MGLPSVMGVAFAYMPILTTIGMEYGISAIFGSQLVAAFASIFIGMFIGRIRRFFPPIVCGTVVLAIGLSLYSTAINYFGGGSAAQAAGTFGSGQFWILALVTLATTLACSLLGKGYIKVLGHAHRHRRRLRHRACHGRYRRLQPRGGGRYRLAPIPLHFGLEFHPDAILMMILMYIVQAVQTIGDVSSTAMGGFGRDASDTELGGAIKGQGNLRHDRRSHRRPCRPTPSARTSASSAPPKVVAKRVFLIVGRHHAHRRLLPQAHVAHGYDPAARARRRHHHGLRRHHALGASSSSASSRSTTATA